MDLIDLNRSFRRQKKIAEKLCETTWKRREIVGQILEVEKHRNHLHMMHPHANIINAKSMFIAALSV